MHKTELKVLVEALRILANDIQSQDGIANACIYEASERLSEQEKQINLLMQTIKSQKQTQKALIKRCDMLLEFIKNNMIKGGYITSGHVTEAKRLIKLCEKGEEK